MTTARTVAQKVGDWYTAYQAVSAELSPTDAREVLRQMQEMREPGALGAAERLARMINANNRAAALVAAMLVGSGVKPVVTGEVDEEGVDV